jgi:curved DNA-binding protein
MARDYYDVLGVQRGASPEEIQQAFRRIARSRHPDINRDPAAEEQFKELNEAYQVLSDPKTRARYDRFGSDFRQIPEDYDERVAAGAGAGGPGGAGRRVRRTTGGGGAGDPGFWSGGQDFDGGGINFEDLFGGFTGGRVPGAAMPGADQEAELPLSVEEAFQGGRRHITLGGPGRQRGYEVNIPRGVIDGQRIRLTGEGSRGRGEGTAGDLYLVVRIKAHPRYRLDGRDIQVDLPVAPWEAVLGATVPVVTPGGTAKVTVPAGSSTGRRLRLRGEGLPNPKGPAGDFFAQIQIHVPTSPSPGQRALFEELAAISTFDPRSQT